ncbi:hypothetical protein ACIBF5_27095 [Micromonospora sp. NPDC050417]|uniref:hypothetical protein n=1 Tax=Micromonospora sp. NPDC050417 TaxID=3364280 RepID=UPI00379E2C19
MIMALPAQRALREPKSHAPVLPLLLATALLVPVVVLFMQVHRSTDADRAFAKREQHGVEYLRSLGHVTVALLDAEAAAVAGRPTSAEPLDRAVTDMTVVDVRLGDELLARERWVGLRAKIDALPNPGDGKVDNTLTTAYSEATDLLLALYNKVRDFSGLARDPDADSYYLQDSAAEELPEALVYNSRLANLALLASSRGAAERDRAMVELGAARSAALSPAGDLIDGLIAAAEQAESRNLSSELLSAIDAFQGATETLTTATAVSNVPTTSKPAPSGAGAKPGNSTGPKPAESAGTNERPAGTNERPAGANGRPAGTSGNAQDVGPVLDVAGIGSARDAAQTAATSLSTIIYGELDMQLAARVDDLDRRLRLSFGMAIAAMLLTLGAVVAVGVTHTRRRRRGLTEQGEGSPVPSLAESAGLTMRPGKATSLGRERQSAPLERSNVAQ